MVNRSKAKGSNVERELINMFWESGWGAIRVAGSGSMRFPSPDVLASNKLRNIAIECKFVNKEKKYFPKERIRVLLENLEQFSDNKELREDARRFLEYYAEHGSKPIQSKALEVLRKFSRSG